MNEQPSLLTPAEAAKILRCHYNTVLRLIHQGKLRASRFGTLEYRIHPSAIDECLKRTEVEPEIGTKVGTKVGTKRTVNDDNGELIRQKLAQTECAKSLKTKQKAPQIPWYQRHAK